MRNVNSRTTTDSLFLLKTLPNKDTMEEKCIKYNKIREIQRNVKKKCRKDLVMY